MEYSISVSDEQRALLAPYLGIPGPATREDVRVLLMHAGITGFSRAIWEGELERDVARDREARTPLDYEEQLALDLREPAKRRRDAIA